VTVTPVGAIGALVARARAAQPGWEALGFDGRAELLVRASRPFVERADELGRLMMREMGKPLAEASGEAKSTGVGVEARLADMREALAPESLEDGKNRSVIYHDAFGVCAAISPWNFPLAMPSSIVFPALAAGNTVVFKPSEETPLCGQAYADILNEVLPPDVLIVMHGADDQGKALVAADVDLIVFTGSREAGKSIMRAASSSLKRVILELGGKDPLIVLEDADLEKAAQFAAVNSYRNAGQVCVSTERIFVHESVAGAFEDLLAKATEQVRVGPMVNARQRDHVLAQVREAVEKGARIRVGGTDVDGNFVKPTLLSGVTEDMSIAREETFGPVACVTPVASDDEAVARANDTRFGLGAVVFGEGDHAEGVARRLKAGMIGVNKSIGGTPGTPWVGARESGYGFHGSRDGHRQFTQTRVVSRPVSD
jgi:succinate-semialdehyde dehydrogenase/glutarate-semialdehyde dehydrogenase